MYGRTILAGYRRAAPADPKYAAAPTFREFVEYLVELPIDQFDAHWKPVYLQCLPCHLQYRVVGRLDTLARDSAYVLAAIGVPARLPHSHGTRGKTEDTARRHYSTLTPALLDRLYHIYRPDFLLYNYTMDAYRAYLPAH